MSDRKFWVISALGLAVLFLLAAWFSSNYYMNRKIEFVSGRLALLGELRRSAIEDYFATAEAELRFWSVSEKILGPQRELVAKEKAFRETRGDPGPELRRMYVDENPFPDNRSELVDVDQGYFYNDMHSALHPTARLFVQERGYYDFFLVTPSGLVIYSVEKEADFGTDLETGPWRDTALARVVERAMEYARAGEDRVAISDFENYEPSDGVPALFMARALQGPDGEPLGAVALQLPSDELHEIMNFTSGMGRTGETYLVGEDLVMRSDSRFAEESTTLRLTVDTETVRSALEGESGVRFTTDYRGIEVLSAYTRTDVDDMRWAIMAEMDREEILEAAAAGRPALGTMMLFFYGLSLWSLWYLRESVAEEQSVAMSGLFDTDFDAG